MKRVSVRLDDETHRRVKVRAAAEGVAMEALGRAFFEGYAGGNGLSAGEPDVPEPGLRPPTGEHVGSNPTVRASPAERPFQPDWKKGKR